MTADLYDYAIVGAGPAGLQLGHHLDVLGRRYVIFDEADAPGAFFRRFPRHRQLLSINKVHTGCVDPEVNLRFDWNSLLSDRPELRFTRWTPRYFPAADDLVDYLQAYASQLELNVACGTRIVEVRRDGDFVLTDATGRRHHARRVVVATGFSRPNVPPIPGVELAEPYGDMPVDPAGFVDARVLIIGKGNSAFETANHLTETAARIHVASPTSIEMAWRTHFAGHLRAVNNDFLDTYQLKSQNAVLDAEILAIERRDDELAVTVRYMHAEGESETLRYDRVLLCAGFRFDDAIFADGCLPERTATGRLPRMTSGWESTSVPDLFFAGGLTASRDLKRTNSAFIHGFRYNVRALSRLLEQRYDGGDWPRERVPTDAPEIAERLLARLNTSSALWQQFGFLADVLAFDDGAWLYEELPVDYVHDSGFPAGRFRLLATLEFGEHRDEPFAIARYPHARLADRSSFLHPVLRLYDGARLLSEHHVLENLLGEWRDPEQHVRPLLDYVRGVLATVSAAPRPAASVAADGAA